MTRSEPEIKLAALKHARILIVEDSPLMQELLYTCLQAFGIRDVHTVETPSECLTRLRDEPFDLLVADWRLKEHDGVKLIRQIRQTLPDPLRRIPIVLCTGYSDRPRVLEARNSGIHEMLCKPVTPRQLYIKLSSALSCTREFVITNDYVGPARRSQPHTEETVFF